VIWVGLALLEAAAQTDYDLNFLHLLLRRNLVPLLISITILFAYCLHSVGWYVAYVTKVFSSFSYVIVTNPKGPKVYVYERTYVLENSIWFYITMNNFSRKNQEAGGHHVENSMSTFSDIRALHVFLYIIIYILYFNKI
ncbi:hypothetical protein ACJX0J_017285, partial [Zea mays]